MKIYILIDNDTREVIAVNRNKNSSIVDYENVAEEDHVYMVEVWYSTGEHSDTLTIDELLDFETP